MFDLVTFDGTVDHFIPREGYVVYEFACNATIGSSARNAPQGVEIVHCKCGLEIESNDRGNNSMLRLEHPHWMDMCAL